jgi:hypothetical protein
LRVLPGFYQPKASPGMTSRLPLSASPEAK